MKKTNKKGFTIVELVIVIAVIAILSAVLIPTFSGIVKKARLSADQQAVRQMNTTLAAEEKLSDADIYLAFDALAEAGMDAKDYKALSKNMRFFWDCVLNRVVMVENDTTVVYPEEYKSTSLKANWRSLSQDIKKEDSGLSNGSATASTAGKLYDVVDKANSGSAVSDVALGGADINMMGAALTIDKVAASKSLKISNGTIENATAVEATTTAANTGKGNDGIYNMGMITIVEEGATVTLSNVTIKNMNLKDTNAGNCGFLVGTLKGKLVLEDVTIEDSSIIGYTSVGSLVGYITGTGSIEIKGTLTIKNVSVQSIGGRVGQLIGHQPKSTSLISLVEGTNAKVVMTNVTNTIYNCEQNTGSCAKSGCTHGALGFDSTNKQIHSWQVKGDGTIDCDKKENRVFYENSVLGSAVYKVNKTDVVDTDNTATAVEAIKTALGLN